MRFNGYVEIDEAIEAGERVLDRIDEAIEYLNSARNWGIFHMLSKRSLISSMIKHSKMDKAQGVMYDLEHDLRRFASEPALLGRIILFLGGIYHGIHAPQQG